MGSAIKRTLNLEKYVVEWVLDGNEAWDYLENQWTQYTLAIIDWILPGLSGLELCSRLRTRRNPLPVLMLTAKDGNPIETMHGVGYRLNLTDESPRS